MSEEWISASQAWAMVWPGKKIQGGPNAIIKRAASGIVEARASRLVKSGPGEGEDEDHSLPKEFWDGWSLIPNWEQGDFLAKFEMRGMMEEWQAFDVRFNPEQIQKMATAAATAIVSLPLATLNNTAAKRATKYDWEGALIAVVSVANSPDGLPTGYGAQAKIERMLARWFRKNQDMEPAPSELRVRAKRILTEVELSRRSAGTTEI